MNRPPNLGVSIFLYITGILLVILAVVLLLQAFGVVKNVPQEAIWGLVLLSIGSGILSAIRR